MVGVVERLLEWLCGGCDCEWVVMWLRGYKCG